MLYCMNTFEIPALSSGRINDITTRESQMNQIEAIINETTDDDTLRSIHNNENFITDVNNVAAAVRINQLTSSRTQSPHHNDNIVRTSEHIRRRKAASELITLRVNNDNSEH